VQSVSTSGNLSFLLAPNTRVTSDGRIDILDALEGFFNSRSACCVAVNRLLELETKCEPLGFGSESISRVRWENARGRYGSLVAKANTILAMALTLRSKKCGDLKASISNNFVRGLMLNAGHSEEDIAKQLDTTSDPRLTDRCAAAIGLPVTPSLHDQEARANTANSTSNNTVNTFFQPNTVQLHGSASPTPEREEGGMSPYKITGFTEVCTDLEQFRDIKGPGIDVRGMVTYSSATLAAYAERNKAASRLFQLHVREREMELERKGKRQKLELLGEAAKMLQENSAFTQAARHNLARSVAILTTPSTPREKYEDELSSESEEGTGELTITGGDAEVLRQFGITPCPPPPRITASKHFQELTGVSISDKVFEKQLQQAVYNTFKNLYGTEHAHVRGKANKINYTQAELKRLKPVFSRFIEMSNVDKVTTPAEV